jgi:hypothetical protein
LNGENVALPALSVGIDCKPIAGDNLSFEKGVAGSILLKATSMIRRRHPRHAIATKSRKKPGLVMFSRDPEVGRTAGLWENIYLLGAYVSFPTVFSRIAHNSSPYFSRQPV